MAKGDYWRSWDQEAGRRLGPWGSWMKARERQARHRVRRLKAVANMVHSAATLVRPRSRNLRAPCCSLIIPKTGSTSCFLSLYASLAAEVAIQARWRRSAASCGPTLPDFAQSPWPLYTLRRLDTPDRRLHRPGTAAMGLRSHAVCGRTRASAPVGT